MDASSSQGIGLAYDPLKCDGMSMEQKRKLVYEMSQWPDCAVEILQAWSRQEILQILCAELGKERKYTGLTKSKMIELLLKIVCEKKTQEIGTGNISEARLSLVNGEGTPTRRRKSDHPNQLVTASNGAVTNAPDIDSGNSLNCKNSACRAKLNHEDGFCKRCSCCICHQYDDNKDPSLWLICSSDPPFHGVSCGLSCHLECALRHENSGISQDRQDKGLDGSFCCVSCGKVNDLLSCLRKQLVVARDTRRVDILCYRLSLGQKILAGTKHYQNLYEIIDEAVKKLEEDGSPLTGLPVKKARGIVNRLSSGPEIQRLCASAVEFLDLILANRESDTLSDWNTCVMELVKFEDIRSSSLTVILNYDHLSMNNVVGYSLWHRKAADKDYPSEPTCRMFKPNGKITLSDLTATTRYCLKVVALNTDRRQVGSSELHFQTGSTQDDAQNVDSKILEAEGSPSPATNCSILSNPSSVEDEINNSMPGHADKIATANSLGKSVVCGDKCPKETAGDMISLLDVECGPKGDALLNAEEVSNDDGSNAPSQTGLDCIPYVDSSEAGLPITPCKFENLKENIGPCNIPKFNGKDVKIRSNKNMEPQAGSSSKKRNAGRRDKECDGIGDKDFEYYVKVIRWLECNGHMEKVFRQKFLTWYSLGATPQEGRVVKAFIDTFVEDPESLAEQLVYTFSDVVSNKRCCTVPAGFCTKLWH